MIRIGGVLENHEINDKIILACAIMLECPLISFIGLLLCES
jgi:hypothetical protein